MNQKIRELAEQADCKIDRLGYGKGDLEKFAELIVQECIIVLDENDGATHHTELLKKHFGVEE